MLFIIGLLIGAVMVVFALQNVTPITVTFLAWQIEGQLAFILLLAVVAGLLISALLSIPGMIKNQIKFSSLRKHNKKLAEELEAHKQILNQTQTSLDQTEPVLVQKETVTVVREDVDSLSGRNY